MARPAKVVDEAVGGLTISRDHHEIIDIVESAPGFVQGGVALEEDGLRQLNDAVVAKVAQDTKTKSVMVRVQVSEISAAVNQDCAAAQRPVKQRP
jgi:hypothetical protein